MSAGKEVMAPATGAKMGPAGDVCHMQIAGGAGTDKPMRSKKMNAGGYGFSVTGGSPTPSQTMDLEKRP
jgi:hypothetical protein